MHVKSWKSREKKNKLVFSTPVNYNFFYGGHKDAGKKLHLYRRVIFNTKSLKGYLSGLFYPYHDGMLV